MLKISEFSKLCGLSIDTLYHYEKVKILIPAKIDENSGYRNYDVSQLATANKLLALKDAGFSLKEISKILHENPSTSLLLKTLEKKSLILEEELNKESKRLERLYTSIFLIKNGSVPMANEIIIKKIEPILVTSIRKKISKNKFDNELEIMWKNINQYIDNKKIKPTTPCMMIYHKGWFDLEKWIITDETELLDVEVIEPIIKPIESNNTINVYDLPMIEKMVCIIHNGSYSTIEKTNEALFQWIKLNGYTPTGVLREIYHKGDWITDNPEEYITEIQVSLK